MFVEIARLWQDVDGERAKMQCALREAVCASQELGNLDPRLVNNLAVLGHLEDYFNDTRVLYEAALTNVAGAGTSMGGFGRSFDDNTVQLGEGV